MIDQFHGEYEFDVYDITLHSKRGHDNGVVLRYGKNITDLVQEENITNTITGVVPYWTDMNNTETVVLPEKVVYSQYADRYSTKLTVPLDLSDQWDEAPTETTLRTAAEAYVSDHNLGVPTVSITVSFVNLRDTAEYADIASLETVNLCDDVHVQFKPLGIDTTAEVVKCVWNVLAERYNEISVGSLKSSLTSTLNKQNSQNVAAIEKTKVQAGNAINKATAWLSSGDGYIVAIKGNDGEWKELLAMDTNDIETAQKVMRLNENGLGGSTHGVDGPYNAAILVDGTIVADAVKTGILTDLNDKFYLNMETGELLMQDGTFKGTIEGSVIKWGDSPNYAQMYWKHMHDQSTDWYELAMEATHGEPIEIVSEYGSSNHSHLYLASGEAILYANHNIMLNGSNVSTSGQLTAGGGLVSEGNITASGAIYSNGYQVPYSFTAGVNISTFTSNGENYLGIYHGSSLFGYVKLTSS